MAYRVDTGGGVYADVTEPTRDGFPDNLSGAVQYVLAHTVYNVLESMGGALGSFLAGLGVQFLDRIEPDLVDYVKPIIELILAVPDLPPALKELFSKLQNPQHAGAAMLLSSLAGTAVSGVSGNVLAPLLAKLTYVLNRQFRPALVDQNILITAYRLGLLSREEFLLTMSYHGLTDGDIERVLETARPRPGPNDLLEAWHRGIRTSPETRSQLLRYGYQAEDVELLIQSSWRLLGVSDWLSAWHRGIINDQELQEALDNQGILRGQADVLKQLSALIPNPADLVRMSVREAYNDSVARAWSYDEDFPAEFAADMAKQGYGREWSTRYWRAHWALPSLSSGYEMFHRGIISQTELETLLRVSDLPQFWRGRLLQAAYNPLTRVDVRRMYGLGVLDRTGVKRSYLDLGYDDRNAERMTDFTVLYEADDPESKLTEYKQLTRSVVITAYTQGILTRGEAQTRLMSIGYPTEEIDILLELADLQQEQDDLPDVLKSARDDIRNIAEKAYSRRLVSPDELKSMLGTLGYSGEEADLVRESVDFWYEFEQLQRAQTLIGNAYQARGYSRTDAVARLGSLGIPAQMQGQLLAEWDLERAHPSRRLTEAQYRKCLIEGLINVDEYKENMRGLGYTEYDVYLLAALAAGVEAAGTIPLTGPQPES